MNYIILEQHHIVVQRSQMRYYRPRADERIDDDLHKGQFAILVLTRVVAPLPILILSAKKQVDNLQRFQSKWKMNIVSRKGLISRKQRTGLLFGFLSPQNRQITLRTIFRVASKEVLFWASYIWLLRMRQLTRL